MRWGLEGVKPGDLLLVTRYSDEWLSKVDRVTATLAICGNTKYRINDGQPTPRDRWSTCRAHTPDADDIERVRRKVLRNELVKILESRDAKELWSSLTLAKVKQLLNTEPRQ